MDFHKPQSLRQLIEKHRHHALQLSPLTPDKPDENRQGQQDEPGRRLLEPNHSNEHQFQGEQRPKHHFRLKRPDCVQTAPDQLPFVRMVLGNRDQQQTAPAAPGNFHVVLAPSDIRFVRPIARLQFPQDAGHIIQPIDSLRGPILNFIQRFAAVEKSQRIERVLRRQLQRALHQPPVITRKPPHNRLQKEQQRHQRSGPPFDFILRERRLPASESADTYRKQQTRDRQRQQPLKDSRQHRQRQDKKQIILQRRAQHQRRRRRGYVNFWNSGAAKQAVINHRRAQLPRRISTARKSAPATDTAAEGIKILRMLPHEQRLGVAVTFLLLQVGADRRTTIMPHERRGTESNPAPRLLQSASKRPHHPRPS